MDTTIPDGGTPERWAKAGRFFFVKLPSTSVAVRLRGGKSQYVAYGEFDTGGERDVWRQFLYDPLTVLVAEKVPLPSERVHIVIVKSPDDGREESADYQQEVEARRAATEAALATANEPDRDLIVTTTVLNHERGLNPRIAQVIIYS